MSDRYPAGNGNITKTVGTFYRTDGSMSHVADVLLNVDKFNSIAAEWLEVSDEIAALPDVAGCGYIYSLHQAMARDEVLTALVKNFTTETNLRTRNDLISQIIYCWAGVEDVAPDSRGANIDARQLEALEKFVAKDFKGRNSTTNPNPEAADILETAFRQLSDYVYAQIEMQSILKPLYNLLEINYDETSGKYVYNTNAVMTYIDNVLSVDTLAGKTLLSDFVKTFTSLGLVENSNFTEFSSHYTEMGEEYRLLLEVVNRVNIYGTESDDTIEGTSAQEAVFGYGGNDTIKTRQGDDIVYGGDGDDYIDTCEGNDIIFGEGGNDTILSGAGDDIVYGGDGNDTITNKSGNDYIDGGDGDDTIITQGKGNETLIGGKGNDYFEDKDGGNETFIFNKGDGQDHILNVGGNDKIIFGEGITPENIKFHGKNYDLYITFSDSSDSIKIDGYLQYTGNRIEIFEFSDGRILTPEEVMNRLVLEGTDENDTITGTQFTETIYGYGGDDIINSGAGDDIVYGGDGNDTITNTRGHDYIDGGAGDDIIKTFGKYNETLIGGKGNDYFEDKDGGNETFIFNKGDGQDHILNVGGNDTIHFGEGVRLEDIVFWKKGNSNDLIIDYGSEPGEDVIRIEQYRLNANHQIENFELETSEGEIMRLTNEDVNRLIQDMTAYAADNGIVLSSAADVRANEDLMTLIASSWAA